MPRDLTAHNLVANTAKEMAGALYEELAKNDEWYRLNPSQTEFIERSYGTLLAQARRVLAGMLAPTSGVPEDQKEQIFEALTLDATLTRRGGRRVTAIH